jgi:hypothetical protein
LFNDGVSSFIESSTNNIQNSNTLNVNKYCNQDVLIYGNTSIGPNAVSTPYALNVKGGFNADDVTVTNLQGLETFIVHQNGNTQIGAGSSNAFNCALKIKAAQQYQGLDVVTNYTTDYGYNTKLWVNRDLTTALSVANTVGGGYGITTFNVMGNGQTQIGNNTGVSPIGNAMLNLYSSSLTPSILVFDNTSNKVNFKVGSTGDVTSREFNIIESTTNNSSFSIKNNGYLYARELNVYAANLAIPDYVFEKNYNLRTLAELEEFINTNKHLPNIPSAKEIKDKGTLSVSDLNLKLLEKVEELTLYVIEQNKRAVTQDERIAELEKNKK